MHMKLTGLQGMIIALIYFPVFFTLSYYKMIANGHVDLLEKDRTFLQDPEKYMTPPIMHSFHEPFC